MILPLQSLRFIFAIMIFLHHFPIDGVDIFTAGGDCGISFFIILSGFVLSAGYKNKVLDINFCVEKFFFNRIIKIYPVHLLCLLFMIFFLYEPYSDRLFIDWQTNFVLLQSWNLSQMFYFSGNDVSWFLSDMVFFYLMFPIVIVLKNHISFKKLYIPLTALLAVYFTAVFNVDEAQNQAWIYINPLFRFVDFFIGMCLYDLFEHIISNERAKKDFKLNNNLFETSAIFLFIVSVALTPIVPEKIRLASLYWIPSCALILFFALGATLKSGFLTNILSNKLLASFGSISFCFYIVHKMIIDYFTDAETGLQMHWALQLVFCLAVTLVIALALHKLVEKPVSKLLRIK